MTLFKARSDVCSSPTKQTIARPDLKTNVSKPCSRVQVYMAEGIQEARKLLSNVLKRAALQNGWKTLEFVLTLLTEQ